MTRKSTLMLAAAVLVLGAAGVAVAQPGPRGGAAGTAPVYDPAQLPQVKGRVAHYLLTPRGDVAGLILEDGTEVHIPPFVSTQLVFAARPGDAVTIHGLKASAIPMIAARSVTNDATGATVLVTPPQHGHHGAAAMTLEAEGKVAAILHDPRGDASGARLEDGTQIRMPPSEATRLGATLAIGKTVVVRGVGYAGPLGRVIAVQQIGPDKANLTAVATPRPEMRGHGMMRHGEHRRMREDGAARPPG